MIHVRSGPTGKLFVNGVSNSYDEKYDPTLAPILSPSEHSVIVKRLNSTLATYWPCNTVYLSGYILIPCTLGLSLLCPMLCVSEAETHANRLLDDLSLKAKYFDRRITFRIVKGCFTSHFVISFPIEETDIEKYGFRENRDEEWNPLKNTGEFETISPSSWTKLYGMFDEPGRVKGKEM